MTTLNKYTEVEKSHSGRPLQSLSYAEKVKGDNSWGKQVINYFIDNCSFGQIVTTGNDTNLNTKQLYDAYNNKIDEKTFNYATNPLQSDNPKYKGFPAKIRPYNIIRPNIDLLIGEWNKRPFQYDVVNADGEDAFNSFEHYKTETYHNNVTQRFVNTVYANKGEEASMVEVGNPQTIMSELSINYKDAKALKGYRALKVLELDLKLREVWRQLFKDWLIAGEVYTLKIPLHGNLLYLRLSPLSVGHDVKTTSPYIENSEFAVVRFSTSTSELVDLFYDKDLGEKELRELETQTGISFTHKLYSSFNTNSDGIETNLDKHDLFYVTWKSKKKVGFLSYPDPFSGVIQYDLVDEDYQADKEIGEEIEWMWVNEVWQGWRVGENRFFDIKPVDCQRNEMNNFSECKLPINGKRFSNTESENISTVYLGMPYQILYIILMYRLELTIAKSKGKVVLLDRNVIPNDDDLDEEGFIWYSEALGYALVDPSEGTPGFNQYQVLDLSLFQHIKELMSILDYVKAQWDELLGISRQRKGDLAASDGLGTAEQAIFRSSVISDLIFTGFEEFLETELTGLLDLSKYAWVDGKKASWRNDEGRQEMLSIEPDDYTNSSFGVYVKNMSKYLDQFNALKQNINAIAQRKDVKTSTVIELLTTESFTELKALVKKAEAVEQEIIKQSAENEQAAKMEQDEAMRRWEEFKHYLDMDKLNLEWDRKDNNEYIKAELTPTPTEGNGVDVAAIQKNANDRLEKLLKDRQEKDKLNNDKEWQKIEREKIASQERIAKDKNRVALKNKTAGEK